MALPAPTISTVAAYWYMQHGEEREILKHGQNWAFTPIRLS